MPRAARIISDPGVYHILTRGNNKQIIFREKNDFKSYLHILKEYKKKYEFRLYHYVLMDNHVHLVPETIENEGRISEIMKGINLAYVQHFRKKYKYIGHFWQDRFKSIVVAKDNYLLACGSYIELNPVRAGLVSNPGHYEWSSYAFYAFGKENNLLDINPIYESFGNTDLERQRKYVDFVGGQLKEKGAQRGEMDRCRFYGSKELVKEMERRFNIESRILPQGRPWKK